ncbi:hypothetical protein HQ447_00820 [bacterium]|nr:hypothetical protein [bacterium]
MKIHLLRLSTAVTLAAFAGTSLSCMNTYDSYGRPVQSVDPGLAVAGIAAAGVLGYAAANNNNDKDRHYRGDRYRGDGYRRDGYRRDYYR